MSIAIAALLTFVNFGLYRPQYWLMASGLMLAAVGIYYIERRILAGAGWAWWAGLAVQTAITLASAGLVVNTWAKFVRWGADVGYVEFLVSGLLLTGISVYSICRLLSRRAREWFRFAKRCRTEFQDSSR
jgi:hypothetical protein